MFLIVDEKIGFDVDESYVHFGSVMPEGSSEKTIVLTNIHSEPLKVNMKTVGELSDWINITENNFILNEYAAKNVTLIANVPFNAEYGNYTGKLIVLFRK